MNASFEKLTQSIKAKTTLAYKDQETVQIIFTDASDYASAGAIFQVHPDELTKAPDQMDMDLLAFFGHTFSGSEIRWSTPDKEARDAFD
jgi:phage terminase large subunit GpA-like protein